MIRSRAVKVLAAAALVAGGLTAVTSGSAAAAPSAALSCYGSAKSYTADSTYYEWPQGSELAVTTSNCVDINVKPNNSESVRTCFWPSDADGWQCNAYRSIAGGTWGLAATNVKNGTSFYVQFQSTSSGLIAY
ncbi:hypothetical protein [Streptomyces sp. NBC_01483]|uniref:hypothetical protein n=1 Tax=Streptomyces sp. NBC_01483 TaxID=2903883 RepID=UPI002E2FEE28|nr:hypothetical protein [Streptomyces sp. NBC_01483]